MMKMRGVLLNAILAATVTTGFAVAQDAPPPPPPDSQYPAATNDSGQYATPQSNTIPQYSAPSTDQPQANQPTADQPEEGGYPQTAQSQQAPPPPADAQQQSNTSNDDSQDPSRRVARMQFMDGQVSIQPGGVNDWVAGTLNRPMTTGDNVWTDKDSKAELNVGTGVFRMGAETSVTLANVGDNTTQLQVHQGTLNLRVRHLYDGETYEIDTPNMAFTVQKPGDYRFDVDPNADTSYVTVWKGEGNATGDGPSVEVRQGDRAKFSNGTSMAYKIDRAPGRDQFDEWAMARDRHDENSVSAKYVSPDVIGSSDLDDYGNWRNDNQYGNVWVPNNQDDNWQPYSDGNWMYQQPYGWTWVGYEPWGFAPYHYGRWVYGGWGGWGWVPGPYSYWGASYYAPALVSWYGGGWGGGWGIGVGFGGGWGWCALGWGEAYHPWYGHGRSYFNNVNITNTHITNITNIYNNYGKGGGGGYGYKNGQPANYRHGLVVANGKAVANGLPIRNNRMNVTPQQKTALLQHPVNARNLGSELRPTAQSRVGGAQARTRTAVKPPASAVSRPTYSKLGPAQRGRGGDTVDARNVNARNGGAANARNNGALNARNNGTAAANNGRPNAGLNNGRGGMTPNNSHVATPMAHNVPRPPSAGVQPTHNGAPQASARMQGNPVVKPSHNGAPQPSARMQGNSSANGHYVPRPPMNNGRQMQAPPTATANGRSGGAYARPGQSYSAPQAHNVPRPSGPVQQPSRSYSAPPTRSYSSPSYGRSQGYSSPSYGRSPSYRSYSSPNYGRSYSPSPSYGRSPSYSAPHYSAPSSPRYSAPSAQRYSAPSAPRYSAPHYSAPSAPHYSAPSYGGGGHSSAPSYHGGGGGGGGRVSSGGGSHGGGNSSHGHR